MAKPVRLTSPEQARPIIADYLCRLYRRTHPSEELHVVLPDGRYAELFPAYCDDGGLLQVDLFGDESAWNMTESQNVDKIRGKRNFARDFASQVEFVLENLEVVPRTLEFSRKNSVGRVAFWTVANAYVGELWRDRNGKPVAFPSKKSAEAYAEAEMLRLGLDRDESRVVRYV